MIKRINIVWKIFLIILLIASLLGSMFLFINRDKIITKQITMNYLLEIINNNDADKAKEFVAKSNNDVLYHNFVNTLANNYYFDGVSNFSLSITNMELYEDKKHQCYFSNMFDNYSLKCDEENEGKYMNYLVDLDINYSINGEKRNHQEKGLISLVKDMSEGNYFTWKLVRFDRYKIA